MSTPPGTASPAIRVGLLDSGCWRGAPSRPERGLRFWCESGGPQRGALLPDRADHGTRLATILRAEAGDADLELLDAQIFGAALRADPATVAAGLDWLVEAGARIINMSFGLLRDDPTLRAACARAAGRGALLIAATPVRGAPVYPARYPGVLRVCGDARCAQGEISALGGESADFGAAPARPGTIPQDPPRGGSSFACARVTAAAVRELRRRPGVTAPELRSALETAAAHWGPQRRPSGRARNRAHGEEAAPAGGPPGPPTLTPNPSQPATALDPQTARATASPPPSRCAGSALPSRRGGEPTAWGKAPPSYHHHCPASSGSHREEGR